MDYYGLSWTIKDIASPEVAIATEKKTGTHRTYKLVGQYEKHWCMTKNEQEI